MILNRYLIIFFVLLLIIISLSLINYLFKEKKDNSVIKPIKYIESFELEEKIEYNNLIKNGDFQNGKDTPNHITQSGFNKIIMMKNPGKSSYVLEQRKSDTLTYYELLAPNDKNSKYNLYFWLSIGDQDINNLNFERLVHIKIQNEDFGNYIPRLNYNIIQKVILSNDDKNTWYLLKYDFVSDNNTKDKMLIYLNYDTDLQFNNYYFTGLSLYRTLMDAENFIYNNGLICYCDGYQYENNTPTFHDLSGNGNDMHWTNIPLADYTIGSLNMLNSKLVGFQTDKLSNEEFTILICLNKNFENVASDNYVDNIIPNSETKDSVDEALYLISMPGNDRYSFEIMIKENYIYLINGKNKYKSKNEIILYNKSLLAITYKEQTINVFYDGLNIISQKVQKIYFSKDNFFVNRNRNLNYNLYSILFYNRVIDRDELNNIRTYFITNKDKNFNLPDINNYHMNNTALFSSNNEDNSLIKPYNKRDSNNSINMDTFNNRYNNQSIKLKETFSQESCSADCNNLCNPFQDSGKDEQYNQCVSNCKNVLSSCQEYCQEEEGTTSVYCNPPPKNIPNYTGNTGCPIVYKKDGNYMVFVQSTGIDKSYGSNMSKARYMYNLNYPQCPTPSELINGGNTNTSVDTCPYIMNEANPCDMNSCAGVNWNVDNYQDLNLNKNCKKMVSNYCQINYQLDDKCSCWIPSNKDDPKCVEYRKYFEDPKDYCSPSQFNIEDHPDFGKYIKKDNIPCWGCNVNM